MSQKIVDQWIENMIIDTRRSFDIIKNNYKKQIEDLEDNFDFFSSNSKICIYDLKNCNLRLLNVLNKNRIAHNLLNKQEDIVRKLEDLILYKKKSLHKVIVGDKNSKTKSMRELFSWIEVTKKNILETRIRDLRNSMIEHRTGLGNRNVATLELERKIRNYFNKNMDFALCIVDLDNFKEINDNFGHEMGDLYLQRFAKECADNLNIGNVYRTGGDEFWVLIDSEYSKKDMILQEFEKNVFSVKQLDVGRGCTPMSVGVCFAQGINWWMDLIKKGDSKPYNSIISMYKDYENKVPGDFVKLGKNIIEEKKQPLRNLVPMAYKQYIGFKNYYENIDLLQDIQLVDSKNLFALFNSSSFRFLVRDCNYETSRIINVLDKDKAHFPRIAASILLGLADINLYLLKEKKSLHNSDLKWLGGLTFEDELIYKYDGEKLDAFNI